MCIVDIVQLLEPIKEMLHTELTRKLTSTDAALKDSISKLVRSKVTVELNSLPLKNMSAHHMTSVCLLYGFNFFARWHQHLWFGK